MHIYESYTLSVNLSLHAQLRYAAHGVTRRLAVLG